MRRTAGSRPARSAAPTAPVAAVVTALTLMLTAALGTATGVAGQGAVPQAGRGAAMQAGPPQVGPERGTLVVVGGAMRDPAIYRRFIELAGEPDAPILYIPTAGGGGDYDDFCPCLNPWRENGARNIHVLHTYDPEVADTEEFVEPLKHARGVFFGGGRQWRLVDAYGGTRTEEELRRVLERGGVIGGSSAGASIQGSFLVRGDTRTNTIMMGDHQRGFGYLRNVGIDQHVLRRNRHYDLLEVIEAHPDLLGIALDENTALVIRGDRAEVMGASYALIYDRGATVNGREGGFYFLAPGDRFNLATREAVRPARSLRPLPNVGRGGGGS
ncbi:MAG: cyanophycinase [Gemmatimonadota bacterium]